MDNSHLNQEIDENTDVFKWTKDVLQHQSMVVYDSLTSFRDFNHIVKSAVQRILDRLRNEDECSEHLKNSLQSALQILLSYLKSNEIWKPSDESPLTAAETAEALKNMCVSQYSKIDRKFDDPSVIGQTFGLYSFKPTLGSTPDADGNYGMLRLRGNFVTENEARRKAEELIKYNSANKIFVVEIGRSVFVKKALVDMNDVILVDDPENPASATIKYADLIKEETLEQKKEKEEVLQRERELLADVATDQSDKNPLDLYTELHKKRGTLTFHYKSFAAKLTELKANIIKVRERIAKMDDEHPSFKEEYVAYYEKHLAATGVKEAGDKMAMQIKASFGQDDDLGF